MSDLVGTPNCWFSHAQAIKELITLVIQRQNTPLRTTNAVEEINIRLKKANTCVEATTRDPNDLWKVFPRQVLAPHCRLLISSALVVSVALVVSGLTVFLIRP